MQICWPCSFAVWFRRGGASGAGSTIERKARAMEFGRHVRWSSEGTCDRERMQSSSRIGVDHHTSVLDHPIQSLLSGWPSVVDQLN
jgi:hypothetical protein